MDTSVSAEPCLETLPFICLIATDCLGVQSEERRLLMVPRSDPAAESATSLSVSPLTEELHVDMSSICSSAPVGDAECSRLRAARRKRAMCVNMNGEARTCASDARRLASKVSIESSNSLASGEMFVALMIVPTTEPPSSSACAALSARQSLATSDCSKGKKPKSMAKKQMPRLQMSALNASKPGTLAAFWREHCMTSGAMYDFEPHLE